MVNSLFQFIFFIALVWGVSYAAQIKITELSFRLSGRRLYLLMSSVGVMLHELSHAIVAILFGHKVNKIVFFSPDAMSGTLGYVNHSYNPANIYHRLGCFFIGFAPLYLAPVSIYLISYLLLPNFHDFEVIISYLGTLPIPHAFASLTFISDHLSEAYQTNPTQVLIWLLTSCSIALSCGPSPADIKNSLSGAIPFALLLYGLSAFTSLTFPSIIVGGAYLLLGLCLLQIAVLSGLLLSWVAIKKILSLPFKNNKNV